MTDESTAPHPTAPPPAQPADPRRAVARVAWIVLLVLSAGFGINHIVGVATYSDDDADRLMFTVFAGLNIYAVVVLLFAYRSREAWAWGITWVSVAVFAIGPLLVAPPIGLFYLAAAAVMAAAQLTALPDFRRR